MKQLTFALLWCFPVFLFGQKLDSLQTIIELDSLFILSKELAKDGLTNESDLLLKQAEEKCLAVFEKETVSFARVQSNKAYRYYYQADYARAISILSSSITIWKQINETEHLGYANTLSLMGYAHRGLRKNAEAVIYLTEARKIHEKQLGKTSSKYITNTVNLGTALMVLGRQDEAEEIFTEVLAVNENTAEKSADIIGVMDMLSTICLHKGEYEKAEELGLETVRLRKETIGKASIPYCGSIINLGQLYYTVKNYKKAKSLYLEAKHIFENDLAQTEHPFYNNCMMSLGDVYQKEGAFKKAEPILVGTVEKMEQTYGKEHPYYAFSLASLAGLYVGLANFDKSEKLWLEVVSILEKTMGKEHQRYIANLGNLAHSYNKEGDLENAEKKFLEVADLFAKTVGKEHPDYEEAIFNLSSIYLKQGQVEKAEPLLIEQSDLTQSLILKSLHFMSEQELNYYYQYMAAGQDMIFSLAQTSGKSSIIGNGFDNMLFYKGFLLNAINQTKKYTQTDTDTSKRIDQLKSCQRSLAREYTKPFAARDSANIIDLEAKANSIEKDLVRYVAGYGDAMLQVKWQDVKKQLKSKQAAIEFVRYKNEKEEKLYAALLLRSDNESPKFLYLFEEKQLKGILENKKKGKVDHVNGIYKNESVYKLLWQPLEKELAEIKTIYYSPSGLLHRLNLNAISLDEKRTVGNKYNLVQVNSTRELVLPTIIEKKSGEALLFGGIQYNMDTTAIASVDNDFEKTTTRGSLNFSQSDSTLRGDNWSYLDWTEVEVSAIESILEENGIPTNSQVGHQATEEAFKSINQPSPRILHIATHGFFFPDPKQRNSSSETGDPIFKISDHPMIRSGLIMAGANHAWETGKPFKPNMEDGILTAYEISQMDLSNTELVVLSACDTGLGDIEGNEGVYGLQRAFKIAGAKYLIMSLWQVPDYQTQQLMTVFYNNMLTNKMEIPDAFRSAQQEMQKKYEDPFLWAGFVLVE